MTNLKSYTVSFEVRVTPDAPGGDYHDEIEVRAENVDQARAEVTAQVSERAGTHDVRVTGVEEKGEPA